MQSTQIHTQLQRFQTCDISQHTNSALDLQI